MEIPSVNYLAVLVGAVVYYLLGAVWYQPGVFGKAWMNAIGKTEAEIKAASGGGAPVAAMIGMFVLAFLSTTALAWAAAWADAVNATGGMAVALVVTLGFHLTAWGSTVLFDQRPWNYLYINLGYHLVGLVLAAIILMVWPW